MEPNKTQVTPEANFQNPIIEPSNNGLNQGIVETPKTPLNIEWHPSKTSFFVLIIISIVLPIAIMLAPLKGPMSTRILLALIVFVVSLFISVGNLLSKAQIKNNIIHFKDEKNGRGGQKMNIPISAIQELCLGKWDYVSSQLPLESYNSERTKSVMLAGGVFGLPVASGVMARQHAPYFALLSNGQVYAFSTKPYSKKDCQKLVDGFRASGIKTDLQEGLL